MTPQALTELADRLEAHNRWRRGDDSVGQDLTAKQIGLDLEDAVRVIRLAALRDSDPHLFCPACQARRAMMAIEAGR